MGIGSKAAARYADDINSKFDSLELVQEGESKIIRRVDDATLAIRLKPTVYSFTHQRYGEVPGTEILRLKASIVLWQKLIDAGIPVPVVAASDACYLCKDVDAPPIEVIVKSFYVGTPKHLYRGLTTTKTRHARFIEVGSRHEPYVRFDWRNPLPDKDECLPIWLADQFIDTSKAELLALKAFDVLSFFLSSRGIEIQDICFFIDAAGSCIFGEISPDCMRVKYRGGDLDKDLWRDGKTAEDIISRWSTFVRLIEG
jgi:phosphoribosylaminoimidazole-succinocarboxamide synthase